MQQVKKGDTVKVHYHGKLTDGTTFDSSEGREPLEFEVGGGMVIPGFDTGVSGMTIGEKKTITIPADEAYGPKQEEMIMEFPKDRFPEDMVPEAGMQLNMSNEQGQNFPVVIVEIRDEVVILDANHPLAGEDLTFDLELVEISGSKPLENNFRFRALNGKQADVVRDVLHFSTLGIVLRYPVPIFVNVRSIYNQHVSFFINAIHQQIINNSAIFIRET